MAPERRYGMDHEHYPWSPLPNRPTLKWPGNARLALCVIVNLEHLEWQPHLEDISHRDRNRAYEIWEREGRPSTEIPADVRRDLDVVYAVHGDRKMLADVFHPAKEAGVRRSAVLVVHGGAWRSGSKWQLAFYALKLCSCQTYLLAQQSCTKSYVSDISASPPLCFCSLWFCQCNVRGLLWGFDFCPLQPI